MCLCVGVDGCVCVGVGGCVCEIGGCGGCVCERDVLCAGMFMCTGLYVWMWVGGLCL